MSTMTMIKNVNIILEKLIWIVLLLQKKGHNVEKSLEDFTHEIVNLFVFNFLLNERNYRTQFKELIKNDLIKRVLDADVTQVFQNQNVKDSDITEILRSKSATTFTSVLSCLQVLGSYIRLHPKEASEVFNTLMDLCLNFPVRKIFKHLITKFSRSIIISLPTEYIPQVFDVMRSALQKVILVFNNFTNIGVSFRRQAAQDLLDVNSEVFEHIKYKELVDISDHYAVIRGRLGRNFLSLRTKSNYIVQKSRSVISTTYFVSIFSTIHIAFMRFINSNVSTLLANNVTPIELMHFLNENFSINKVSAEFFNNQNILTTIVAHLDILTIMKTQKQLNSFYARYLQKFYYKTLKFGLINFSKNAKFYLDGSYEPKRNLRKIEKSIDSGIKTCRYLKNETFLENINVADVYNPYKFKNFTIDESAEGGDGSKLPLRFLNRRSRYFWKLVHTSTVGSLYPSRKCYLGVAYDATAQQKVLSPSNPTTNKYQNLRKLLMNLVAFEVDCMKAFNKTEMGNIKYEFTLEEKYFQENEIKPMVYYALGLNTNLMIFILRRLNFAIPEAFHKTLTNSVRELVTKYYIFNFQYKISFDYFVDKNLENPNNLRNIFYWDTPQFPLLMKFVTKEHQNNRILRTYFSKTMKRLESEQLTYYLPQIYQILNTNSNYIVMKTLLDYSKKSFLFAHQLIWKAKVETKREKGEVQIGNLPAVSKILLAKLMKGMTIKEKFIFRQVDDFFEQITGISGILRPKMPKPEKKEIIKNMVHTISCNPYLYIPCNPKYRIIKIKLDSGTPMQSAAKCPILIAFYCKKFEGPDKYYEKLLQNEKEKDDTFFGDQDFYDLNIEDGDEKPTINELRESVNIKLFPKASLMLESTRQLGEIPLPVQSPQAIEYLILKFVIL